MAIAQVAYDNQNPDHVPTDACDLRPGAQPRAAGAAAIQH